MSFDPTRINWPKPGPAMDHRLPRTTSALSDLSFAPPAAPPPNLLPRETLSFAMSGSSDGGTAASPDWSGIPAVDIGGGIRSKKSISALSFGVACRARTVEGHAPKRAKRRIHRCVGDGCRSHLACEPF